MAKMLSEYSFRRADLTCTILPRELFLTYRYWKMQLASDRTSLLSPEFGVYVRVVGKIQI